MASSPDEAEGRGPADVLRRHWRGSLALLACLVVVGLPDAGLYSRPGWAPVLGIGSLILAVVLLWRARGPAGATDGPGAGESVGMAAAGAALTLLFWIRADLGAPGVILGDLPLRLTVVLGAWAWPALLLVVLYRRPGEGPLPSGRRRFGLLLLVAAAGGSIGFLAHFPLAVAVRDRTVPASEAGPGDLRRALVRPLETPWAIGLLGGPRAVSVTPRGLVFVRSDPRGSEPREVEVTGRVLPGARRDLSWRVQGTRLVSSDPSVVRARTDPAGRWFLHPGETGGAVVAAANRRARSWIGIWVVEDARASPPTEDVTHLLGVEAGRTRSAERGFARIQSFTIRNESDVPILGPVQAVIHVPAGEAYLVGPRRTRDPVALASAGGDAPERGVAWVEAFPGPPAGTNAPSSAPAAVLGPGESVTFDVHVVEALDPDAPGVRFRFVRSFGGL